MILEKDRDIQVTSTIGGDKIDMSLDQNSLVHLMGVLTNLYSDPLLAIVREYSTNAYDAHVEAGTPAPIEVTLPTELEPYLKIKDYGVGMDALDIADTYSRYGASTKRETNDQQGVLGLGCKSALTYTSVFTLTGTKDGIRTVVSIARDEDGAGSMTIVDELEVDEPNGVEVTINIRRNDIAEIIQTASKFFCFWQPGTVLVHGEQPGHLEGLRVADDLYIIEGTQDYLVMGNVAYPTDFGTHLVNHHSLVAHVPIGAVNFAPSREALNYTRRTKDVIACIKARFQENLYSAVQSSVSEAESSQAAVQAMLDWEYALPSKTLGDMEFDYRGRPIPDKFEAPDNAPFVVVPQHSSKLNGSSRMKIIPCGTWRKALWIHGYDRATFTAGQRKKINKWSELKGVSPQTYILHHLKPDTTWIDPGAIVSWDEIAAIKIPRKVGDAFNSYKTIPGSYEAYESGNYVAELAANDIDTANPVFYCIGNRDEKAKYRKVFDKHHGDYTLIFMGHNRKNKFLRFFPKAVEADKEAKRLYTNWKRGLTLATSYVLAMELHHERHCLKSLDHSRIDDPKLRLAIKRARRVDLTNVMKERKIFLGAMYRHVTEDKPKWDNPLKRYPLYNGWTLQDDPDHAYLYLNAIYAASRKEESARA